MKKKIIINTLFTIMLTLGLNSCNTEFTAITPQDLDNKNIEPKVGSDLLSAKSTSEDDKKQKMVILTSHGYTATPYENKFLLDDLLNRNDNFLGSRVMLGAHGTNVYDFEKASWEDWQLPLQTELDLLQKQGYQNIAVVTTSTSGTLLMDILSHKKYPQIKKIVMVAPLLIFNNKAIQFGSLLQSIGIRSMPNDVSGDAVGNWYHERPVKSLNQLYELTLRVKNELDQKIPLEDKEILIIQSKRDQTVDPISTAIISNGLQTKLKISLYDSTHHIPIVPSSDWTTKDHEIKQQIFDEINQFLKN